MQYIIQEVRKLSVIERLGIITDIWDEIKESEELEAVSEEEKNILLCRLENYKKNPNSATDWTDLKQKIYEKYRQQN